MPHSPAPDVPFSLGTAPLPAVRVGWHREVALSPVGKFITRIQPGDVALWDRIAAEAKRLSRENIPKREAIAALIAVAGDNPRAFGGIGGKSTKGLNRTADGQAVLRLLAEASIEYTSRTG
jgi:hypothetical protein